MFACICKRVRECEIRSLIQDGARTKRHVAQACGAGTSCGMCVRRIGDLIDEETDAQALSQAA
ncbi:bacterioferritin-associated ferredoxin [Catenuloplanes sp. NPDC051500]|jgi:bacterioferritin-associated ferredoxin|uniref:bacterioferritin-associated ferredoxin n=1 Tax=Catenuloplanes sp. NPDC051500 TaxID=3363959 RepID=UPI0037AA3350